MAVRRGGGWGAILPAIGFLSISGLNAADPLPKVWEISLTERLAALGREAPGGLDVTAVGFSPDGARLAIAFGSWLRPEALRQRKDAAYVLVVPVDRPETTLFWADLTRAAVPGGPIPRELTWAPHGKSLASHNVLIRLEDGGQCKPSDRMPDGVGIFSFIGFESAGAAVVATPVPDPQRKNPLGRWTLATIDFQCRILSRWDPGLFRFPVLSPDGLVLGVRRPGYDVKVKMEHPLPDRPRLAIGYTERTPEEWVLQKAGSEKAVKLEPTSGMVDLYPNPVFLGNGRMVCGSVGRMAAEFRIVCWDAQTGKAVRKSRVLWSREINRFPLALLGARSRIAMLDHSNRRRVWDYETNSVIADWAPEVGDGRGAPLPPLAISPDGRFLAEGGPGSVRLYRLP